MSHLRRQSLVAIEDETDYGESIPGVDFSSYTPTSEGLYQTVQTVQGGGYPQNIEDLYETPTTLLSAMNISPKNNRSNNASSNTSISNNNNSSHNQTNNKNAMNSPTMKNASNNNISGHPSNYNNNQKYNNNNNSNNSSINNYNNNSPSNKATKNSPQRMNVQEKRRSSSSSIHNNSRQPPPRAEKPQSPKFGYNSSNNNNSNSNLNNVSSGGEYYMPHNNSSKGPNHASVAPSRPPPPTSSQPAQQQQHPAPTLYPRIPNNSTSHIQEDEKKISAGKSSSLPLNQVGALIDFEISDAWFHPDITRDHAKELLQYKGTGTFLVRKGMKGTGYCLSVLGKHDVANLLVEITEGGYMRLKGGVAKFSRIEVLIDYYKTNRLFGAKLETNLTGYISRYDHRFYYTNPVSSNE